MFSGIVEEAATVVELKQDKGNLHLTLECGFTNELKIDQSIAHNGVCLTVVDIHGSQYTVTAIQETLDKSNLGFLKVGDKVNLERSMIMNGRLDGHIVQGHVDQTAKCIEVLETEGSWLFTFQYEVDKEKAAQGYMTVENRITSYNVCYTKLLRERRESEVSFVALKNVEYLIFASGFSDNVGNIAISCINPKGCSVSDEATMLSFYLPNQIGATEIDENGVIRINVPLSSFVQDEYGAYSVPLVANFQSSYGSKVYVNGVIQQNGITQNNFISNLVYSVKSGLGNVTKDYLVQVTQVATQITKAFV